MNKHYCATPQGWSRDVRLDILKSLGIFLVIMAHVIPSNSFLFQLRNFDVPMMVIVSGILFSNSSSKRYSYSKYLCKRIPRLIAPVWLFLSLFFSINWLISYWQSQSSPFSTGIVIRSFFLTNGINYIWIIKVFILIAIASPILIIIRNKLNRNSSFLICLAVIYTIYETLLLLLNRYLATARVPSFLNYIIFYLVINLLFYLVPYSCIFGIGLTIKKFTQKQLLLLAVVFLAIFLTLGIYYYQQAGYFIPVQNYKTLPRLYYLAYGIFMSLLVYLGVDKLYTKLLFLFDNNSLVTKVITFISSSSLWIFLWHIVFLDGLEIWVKLFPSLSHYLIKYLIVLGLSIFATWTQKKVVSTIIKHTFWGKQQQAWLTTLFLK